MRAIVYQDQLRLETDYPNPAAETGQALLRVRRAGICNTDLELMAGMYGFSGILGHEFVADVVEGSPEWVGKRVVGEINVACTRCDFCLKGVPSQCRHRTTVGIIEHPGAFADYLALTEHNLHAVPEDVSDDQAVFVEPLAAALQIIEAVHISPRDRVIVLGAGKLGMLAAQVLKLTGASLAVVARSEKQAQLLANWHIPAVARDELPAEQAQVVVDCTGTAGGFEDALALVQPRGTVVLKSTFHGIPTVDLTQITVREIKIVGSRCGPFDAALRLLRSQVIDIESLIEGRFSLDAALDAFEAARQPGMLKILLTT